MDALHKCIAGKYIRIGVHIPRPLARIFDLEGDARETFLA
jgi:hypothetical protein